MRDKEMIKWQKKRIAALEVEIKQLESRQPDLEFVQQNRQLKNTKNSL